MVRKKATFEGIGTFRFPNIVAFDGSEGAFDGIGIYRIPNMGNN